jgi:hypothetical protein
VEQCGCTRKILATKGSSDGGGAGYNTSTCSKHSYDRGPRQRVI